jgi:hypothetical protein
MMRSAPAMRHYLYAGMVIAVILSSFYLGSKDQPNPYENRRVSATSVRLFISCATERLIRYSQLA